MVQLSKLRGGIQKLTNQKIDQGGGVLPLYGHIIYFLSCFAHCHIQMYGNVWRRAHYGLIFFSEDRKIINLLEGLASSIHWMPVVHVLRVDRGTFLSSSNIAHLFCHIGSKLMRNQMKECLSILIIMKCQHSCHMLLQFNSKFLLKTISLLSWLIYFLLASWLYDKKTSPQGLSEASNQFLDCCRLPN